MSGESTSTDYGRRCMAAEEAIESMAEHHFADFFLNPVFAALPPYERQVELNKSMEERARIVRILAIEEKATGQKFEPWMFEAIAHGWSPGIAALARYHGVAYARKQAEASWKKLSDSLSSGGAR